MFKISNIIVDFLLLIISIIDKQYKQEDKIINNIFINDNIEILTDTGFKPLTNIMQTKPFEQYTIVLLNGYKLICADTHILFDNNMHEVFAKNLHADDFIQTDLGLQKVVNITINHSKVCMTDITVNDNNHRFYSNGILNHNSVTTAIFGLWFCLFQTDTNGLILSKSGPAGIDLLEKIKDMFLNLPYYLKPGVVNWNQHEIAFDSNSTMHTEAFSDTAGLGQTINFLILDEFAWTPENQNRLFYENVIPTVTTMPNSRVCIMSTQNGYNKFKEIWDAANDPLSGSPYKPFKVDWDMVPQWDPVKEVWYKRDEAWKQYQIGVLGSEAAFYYQYGTQFASSDYCLISRTKIAELCKNEKVFATRDFGYPLYQEHIYWHPEFDLETLKTGYFFILCDLAEGGGGDADSTVFNIVLLIDKGKFKQIGYWKSNMRTLEQAALEFWFMVATLFNTDRTLISIEWNTYGALFYRLLMDLNEQEEFPEFAYRFQYAPEGIDLANVIHYKKTLADSNPEDPNNNAKTLPGIKFTSSNKITACSMLKMNIESDNIIISDKLTLVELQTFEDKNGTGSYKARTGEHDDLIMTFCQIPMLMLTSSYENQLEEFTASNIETILNSRHISGNLYSFGSEDTWNPSMDARMAFSGRQLDIGWW